MMRAVVQSQRGVTLIELMVVVAIVSIFLLAIGTTMESQQQTSFDQLEFIEAQQNARAAIAIIKDYVRGAGWGRPYQTQTQGIAFLGSCFKDGDDRRKQDSCNAVDADKDGNAGNDRIRVVGIEPTVRGSPPAAINPASPTNTMPSDSLVFFSLPVGSTHIVPNNDYAVLSGYCGTAPTVETMELVRVSQTGACSGASPATCKYTIAERVETDPCGGNLYQDGFSFGRALLADFFINRSNPNHPKLMLRLGADRNTNPADTSAGPYTIAWDIDDLQIRYGLDTGDPAGNDTPDGLVDVWCDDLSSNTCAPSFAVNAKQSRIIAARIAVVTRSRAYEAKRDSGGSDLTVFDHTFTGRDDGYRRWIYRATVALRNNQR